MLHCVAENLAIRETMEYVYEIDYTRAAAIHRDLNHHFSQHRIFRKCSYDIKSNGPHPDKTFY